MLRLGTAQPCTFTHRHPLSQLYRFSQQYLMQSDWEVYTSIREHFTLIASWGS